jgi:polygalacturonase
MTMKRLGQGLALAAIAVVATVPVRVPATVSAAAKSGVLSVASFGAVGDGETDDTDAIQKGVDALRAGDTLTFPPGTYRIRTDRGVKLKDDVRLDLGRATLTGVNVRGARCRILDLQSIRNVTITGGTLVGSRIGAPDWAIGIFASDVDDLVIDGVTLRDFFFDGILLTGNRGCRRVTVRKVLAENNRRTGLAVVSADGVTVDNSTFRGTNGQSPEAGLNCEPNAGGRVRNVRISRSTFTGNAGVGLYMHKALGIEVSGAIVEGCRVEGNNQGIVASGVDNVTVTGCRVTGHHKRGTSGIAFGEPTTAAVASGNVLEDNFRSIIAAGATNVTIKGNRIVGTGPPFAAGKGEDGDGIVCRGLKSLIANACVITDNSVRGAAGSGILLQLTTGVQVLSNAIADTGQRGIQLLSSTRSEVRDNWVAGHSLASPGRYAAIELANSSNDNLVANNLIRNDGLKQNPVNVGPGCRGNELFGNVPVTLPWPGNSTTGD